MKNPGLYMTTGGFFLNEKKFIEWVAPAAHKTPPFETFVKRAKVRTSNGSLVQLSEYMKGKKITIALLRAIHQFVVTRNEYLHRVYNVSMKVADNLHFASGEISALRAQISPDPPKPPARIQVKVEPPMKLRELDNSKKPNYKNAIRNMHYEHIMEKTKSGFKNVVSYYTVLNELFTQNIIDYQLLSPGSAIQILDGKMSKPLSWYYFRSSIMNPYLVYSLNASYLHAKRVFTPTLGWTSYMYGFLESGVEEYVGTDVIPAVCSKTRAFGEKFYPDRTIDIYCKPSEDLLKSAAFARKYRAHFDTVFFSPPYYDLETYAGAEQSIRKYPTYELWLEKYWRKTVELCKYVLAPGGKMVYIISDYEGYNLIKDMNEITRSVGFRLVRKENMYNKIIRQENSREPSEVIFIFRGN